MANYYQSQTYNEAVVTSRAGFIRKTYAHLAGALLAFIALETLFMSIPAVRQAGMSLIAGKASWLLVIGAMMLVSWVANRWAHSSVSRSKQYMGLGLFVFFEAIIFIPLLCIAMYFDRSGSVLIKAGLITFGLFLGLSSIVFLTKKDFSFLRGIVVVGGFVALGTIVASLLFGFSLGIIFISIMVAFMAISIVYQTSQVVRDYPEWAYVGASLSLFACFATLLWYVIQLVLSFSRE